MQVNTCTRKIEKAILERGRHPDEVKAVFLIHAHPDHIGTARYFQEKYGAKIYASEGERAWIEDINLQFAKRPIPNFYGLAGKSAVVDQVVKDNLEGLPGIQNFYPAWDHSYSLEIMREKLADAKEIVNTLEKTVQALDCGMELQTVVDAVCDSLHMPVWKTNPLFARTVACCRRK